MIARIIGPGGPELPINFVRESAPAVPGIHDRGDPSESIGTPAVAPAGGFGPQGDHQSAELILSSKPQAPISGFIDRYAKIRYDKGSRTIMIQIIDANSGEVIREMPPDAWKSSRQDIPLPKGSLVENER